MKLSLKIFTVYLFFTLGILVPTGISVYISAIRFVEKQIQDGLEETAGHIFDKMDRVLFERYSDMQTISADPIFLDTKLNPEEITKKLISYRNQRKVYISLSYYDKNCIKIADTNGLAIGDKCKDSTWTREVYSENKISAASDILYLEEIGNKVIVFAAPVMNQDGVLIGAVTAFVPIGRLHQIISGSKDLEDYTLIDLLDHEGNTIYSNHRSFKKDSLFKQSEKEILSADTIYAKEGEQGFLDFQGNRWQLFL